MTWFWIDSGWLLDRFWRPSCDQNPAKIDDKPSCRLDQNFNAFLGWGEPRGRCKTGGWLTISITQPSKPVQRGSVAHSTSCHGWLGGAYALRRFCEGGNVSSGVGVSIFSWFRLGSNTIWMWVLIWLRLWALMWLRMLASIWWANCVLRCCLLFDVCGLLFAVC